MTHPYLTIVIALSLITGAAFVGSMILFWTWWNTRSLPPAIDPRLKFRTRFWDGKTHHVIF